jgi:membrane-associated phospholipid phosphatase
MGGTVALLLMIVIANVANDTDFTFPLAHTAIGFSVYSIICTIYLWSNGK